MQDPSAYVLPDHIVQELDTRFSDQNFGLISAQAPVPCNLDKLPQHALTASRRTIQNVLRERDETLDVEVDKWTTLYNKVPVDSRSQDVCTALADCDPNTSLQLT